MGRTLQAPLEVAFDYTRSTGPVVGRFLTGLRDRTVVAGRTADGTVHVPPPEFDPTTHEPVTDFVGVAAEGEVVSWTWVPDPVRGQPFDRPFAWALVRLDGADTPMLHALDVGSPDEVSTGMRVRVRWADETIGAITDIACFEPGTDEAGGGAVGPTTPSARSSLQGGQSRPRPSDPPAGHAPDVTDSGDAGGSDAGPLADTIPEVTGVITPVALDYTYAASPEESAFFRGLADGRLMGQRCPSCGKVYVPPRGACPVDGVPTNQEVELPPTGTVTTFCIVNVPFMGQHIDPPYVSAYVLLDGADIALQHLVREIDAAEVRMGMRVEAVWKPREEWDTTIENIRYFRPTGEPDASYETYRQHL